MEKNTREEQLENAEEVFGGNGRKRIDRSKKDKKKKHYNTDDKGVGEIRGSQKPEKVDDGFDDEARAAVANSGKKRRVFKKREALEEGNSVIETNNIGKDNEGVIEENNPPLAELSDQEFHGSESPIIEKIDRSAKESFINFLEEKFGKPGTVYVKKNKKGFPVETIEIVDYEIGKDTENDEREEGMIDIDNFVVIDTGKAKDGKPVNKKIKIGELENYLRGYEREKDADFNNQEFFSPEDEVHIKELVEERILEIEAIIAELKNNGGENLKNKLSKYETVFNNAKSIIEKDEHIFKNQSIANIINGIYERVYDLRKNIEEDGTEDAKVEKVSEVENEFGLSKEEKKIFESLSEKEKQDIGKIADKIPELFESGREAFDWEDFPQGRIDMQLENNVIAVLMELFKNKSKFTDRDTREKVAEIVMKIYKNKK